MGVAWRSSPGWTPKMYRQQMRDRIAEPQEVLRVSSAGCGRGRLLTMEK